VSASRDDSRACVRGMFGNRPRAALQEQLKLDRRAPVRFAVYSN